MKKYRKVWIDEHGPIPIDEYGRTYEIHHINGNHVDDRLDNLKCVSILEHYNIHISQCDFGAAASISKRMGIAVDAQRDLNSLAGKQAHEKKLGFHAIPKDQALLNAISGGKALKGYMWFNNGKVNVRSQYPLIEGWVSGKLPCGSGVVIGTKLGIFWNKDDINVRSEVCPGEGWQLGKWLTETQRERRREIGRSCVKTQEEKDKASLRLKGRAVISKTCPYCNKTGGHAAMYRWHFDNCKEK